MKCLRPGLWYAEGLTLSLVIICSVLLGFQKVWQRDNKNVDSASSHTDESGETVRHSDNRDQRTLTIEGAYVALSRYLEQLAEPDFVIKEIIEEGLMSVHAYTSQIWYHTWHGDFVRMLNLESHRPDAPALTPAVICSTVTYTRPDY